MSDKITDHVIKQNEILLRHVLESKTTGEPVVLPSVKWDIPSPEVDALEEELAEANKTITVLKEQAQDYEKLRQQLFQEREENRDNEQQLKTNNDLLETQNANLAQKIAEHEAWAQQAKTRFKQLQEELDTARADATPPESVQWRSLERLLNLALEKFDENPDSAFSNLQRAYSKVATHVKGDE